MSSPKDEQYSDEEAERRVKNTLRRALNTPPQHKSAKVPKPKERPTRKGRVHRAKSRS